MSCRRFCVCRIAVHHFRKDMQRRTPPEGGVCYLLMFDLGKMRVRMSRKPRRELRNFEARRVGAHHRSEILLELGHF